MDEYNPRQVMLVFPSNLLFYNEIFSKKLSTYALTLFRKELQLNDEPKKTLIGSIDYYIHHFKFHLCISRLLGHRGTGGLQQNASLVLLSGPLLHSGL